MEIKNNVYYVGVNDRNKALFEGLWPLPNGVSYNSYLIDDNQVVLIDTVEVDFFTQYIENIREVIGDRKVDYLVINHMEPTIVVLSPCCRNTTQRLRLWVIRKPLGCWRASMDSPRTS